MRKSSGHEARRTPSQSREDRLKAALKANIARRKAQASARAADDAGDPAQADDENANNENNGQD